MKSVSKWLNIFENIECFYYTSKVLRIRSYILIFIPISLSSEYDVLFIFISKGFANVTADTDLDYIGILCIRGLYYISSFPAW